MKILIYFSIAIIFGITIYFVIKNNFNKQKKVIISILAVILFIIISIYTAFQDSHNKKGMDLISLFMQGEILKCGDINISNDKFNFANATLSFIGKKDTEFYGKIISIKQCY